MLSKEHKTKITSTKLANQDFYWSWLC